MQTSHSPSSSGNAARLNPHRIFRLAVLNAVPAPQRVVDQLEAQGINVSDLEARIRHNMEFTR